ncbi:hypothetical protein F7725_014897 [Dissostichus mawsoni]|uniref:Uncharacterized protein n=1 Tax=Dissostichus mawsoni TaxID=36200 RepID=A0A7J5YG85_DISMA|nr:hypothetical protein F7725_014897 [Dissostichus mawsoni]
MPIADCEGKNQLHLCQCCVELYQTEITNILPYQKLLSSLTNSATGECSTISLGKCISQMKTSYHTEMKEVYNGKWPVVHFFLGRKQGYEQLVHLGEITKSGQEEFAVKMAKYGKRRRWRRAFAGSLARLKSPQVSKSALCSYRGVQSVLLHWFLNGGPVALDISYM